VRATPGSSGTVGVARNAPTVFDFDFIYAGFSPAYPMKPKASSKKDFDFNGFDFNAITVGWLLKA
jgi:hypothetical protein